MSRLSSFSSLTFLCSSVMRCRLISITLPIASTDPYFFKSDLRLFFAAATSFSTDPLSLVAAAQVASAVLLRDRSSVSRGDFCLYAPSRSSIVASTTLKRSDLWSFASKSSRKVELYVVALILRSKASIFCLLSVIAFFARASRFSADDRSGISFLSAASCSVKSSRFWRSWTAIGIKRRILLIWVSSGLTWGLSSFRFLRNAVRFSRVALA